MSAPRYDHAAIQRLDRNCADRWRVKKIDHCVAATLFGDGPAEALNIKCSYARFRTLGTQLRNRLN
jgi:hypothetical protein